MLTLLLALQLVSGPSIPAAILDMPRLVAESMEGKAAAAKLEAFRAEREKTLATKQTEINDLLQKKAPAEAVERSQVELQRMTDDAQAELTNFQNSLQMDFFKKVQPVALEIVNEQHIGLLFTFPNPNIIWASPTVDITARVIELLDAATKKALTQTAK